MLAIDTNVVVRYLTGDHPEQSARARTLIDGQPVFVPTTVFLETEWVLRSARGYRREALAHAFTAFAGHPNVTVENPETVAAALDALALGADFADALHLAAARHCDGFATFDERLIKFAAQAGGLSVQAP